ncbi:hypothetical protein [Novosphingopyxis sp.]|uniref:hypothetical protein n=1 Tax=Novosphingopyxis sp. TaxID=2709690 RepID=UPI003B5AB00A
MTYPYQAIIQGEKRNTRGPVLSFDAVPLVLPEHVAALLTVAFRNGDSALLQATSEDILEQVSEMVVALAMELRFGSDDAPTGPTLH